MTLREHFDWVAENNAFARRVQNDFHRQIATLYRRHIPPGARVLEWGCGAGDLLAALEPSRGLGCDFSCRMVEKARQRHSGANLEFRVADAEEGGGQETFDYIVLDYLTGYLRDIQRTLTQLRAASTPRTRLLISTLNTPWLFPIQMAERFRVVMKQPASNWLSKQDLCNLLELSGWEVVSAGNEQLFPFDVPGLTPSLNRFLIRFPLIQHFGITLFIAARPRQPPERARELSCSVVVPARNEAGNIRALLERVPRLGRATEIIFVEGHSRDDTWEAIERESAAYAGPHSIRMLRQPGKGKWDAVRAGFAQATGDVLVIQDADLTAPPEDLEKFFEGLVSGQMEFANGSRLVYPMEARAMQFLNLLGNKFFAVALSYVLGQPVKDSLCGTKMFFRSDYARICERIAPFGEFDPFGDFNLLFGAALADLRIRDIPVRYRSRTYGETNISRFRHGWLLLKMTLFGLLNIRFFSYRRYRPRPGDRP